ncbi:DUF2752 domain-containing protein [Aquimarina addita]|uniref:DUF2752 domain-containing protein n=1 Tax=Aquimarina addita TaxID=870485 RepID=UPI0031E8B49A
MLPCLNKKLFGVDCLGCGLQRSLVLLVKGEFTAAFIMYPAIYPLLLLLAFLGVNFFIKFKNDLLIKYCLIFITVLTMVVSYILKINSN